MAVTRRRNAVVREQQDPNSTAPPHLRRVDVALGDGDAEALRQALDNLLGSIDDPIENGDTALHLACVYGHLTCVQILIERGASLEAKDEDGEIPLHGASAAGYADIVQLLLNKGSEMNIVKRMLDSVDEEGDTPLHHAAKAEHVNVILLLLANGASPTTTNFHGQIPSELADPGTHAKEILTNAVGTYVASR
ncbi:hypothetical protein DCAR_0415812 [Daucus carota subsp. sativus]|uniref:Uncharacterized protein n=1 Tax=Daucus carota subsp. sativus TaxID=79200 RepID=A0AAF0WVC6_DAUCS|nr:PREDICTED: tankyrase-2-like isoform X1 [Daucus carota subsp. sativus]XP_017244667.1 PREDICTED: tankyrase-2-like isoform X1 [Daucus carota subsp. sativus]WOG96477.1 hypothetical protein DCAR_0415812 [Daucus carota subsp. sativus]